MATPPTHTRHAKHLLLDDVDWTTYTRLIHAFAERPHVRLTYNRGMLEITRPLFEHNIDAEFLGALVFTLTEELDLPMLPGGSTTLRRRRKQRGLDPDRCYWIASAPRMLGKRRLDLRVDPPPDLAIEVDVTHRSLDRLAIYAALNVPEVWRLTGSKLTFLVLGPDGKYQEASHSRSFPQVTPADLMRFLALLSTQDSNVVVRQFREWIRQLGPSSGTR